MRRRLSPLLAELHAHTTWSDGELTVRELVDLYGSAGFDVLCVSDHAYRSDDPVVPEGAHHIDAERFSSYLAEIESEACRAWERYRTLVLPGLEISYNDRDPARSAHVVAVGLREYVSLAGGIDAAIARAAATGAALIGAHPDDGAESTSRSHPTLAFAADPDGIATLVHRFELFNRSQLFPWVARAGFASVATGDFHRHEHFPGWKTLVPCELHEHAVVEYLRSPRPVYLARLDAEMSRAAA
jgi:predicted metal-dependent phosphoesterase TrpH